MATVYTHKPDTIDFLYNRDNYYSGTTTSSNLQATVRIGSQRRHFKIGAINNFKLEMPQIVGSMLEDLDITVDKNTFLNLQPSAYVDYTATIDGVDNHRMAIRGAKNIYDDNAEAYNNSIKAPVTKYLSDIESMRYYDGHPAYVSAFLTRVPNGFLVEMDYKNGTSVTSYSKDYATMTAGYSETGVYVMNYALDSLSTFLAGNINTDNVKSYTVKLDGFEDVTIKVHDEDTRFPVHNVHWINKKGGVDGFIFNKRYEAKDEVKATSYLTNGGYTVHKDVDGGARTLTLSTGLICYDEYKRLSSSVYSNYIMMILDGKRYTLASTRKSFEMPFEQGVIPNIDLEFEIVERELVTY